ncbi:hypothetical protein DPMN_177131 [Dreissena polymorpha]|uniref:Uncharacterized protein n=1 Tax=Dreissena polymorpha TaxID=45954 RepID=A0A9D4E9P5_DREPO|nr:hypothetical protein DPMN_177131 [Dreissena polymorpha]
MVLCFFAACTDGTFGSNCEQTCGFCNMGVCSPINGQCQGGCKPGYRGSLCKEREYMMWRFIGIRNKPPFGKPGLIVRKVLSQISLFSSHRLIKDGTVCSVHTD